MRRERDASIRSAKRCTLVVHLLIVSQTLRPALKDVNRATRITVSQALVTFVAEQILEALRCCQCWSPPNFTVPVFLFEVADPASPKGPDGGLVGSVRCVVLHDSIDEAIASVRQFVPHADVSLSKEPADPKKTAAMVLVKGKPRLYR